MTVIIRSLQIVVTLVILAVLWRTVDGRQASEILTSAQPMWLIAGLMALTAQTVLSAIRWRITAAQLGLDLPLRVAIHEYYLSQMINQVLPGGVLGDASRAVRSRGQQGLMAASQAVVFERFAGQVAMYIVMAVAVVATFLIPGGLDWPSWSIPFVLPIVLGGLAAAIAFVLATIVPSPLRPKAKNLASAVTHALLARRVVVPQVTLSFATVLCNLAAFAFCARGVGVVLPLVEVCALVPLILFTMLVPLTIMGWGLREGAAAAFLPLAGVTASAGLAASVAFGLTMLVASGPGLIAIWIGQRSTKPNKGIKACPIPRSLSLYQVTSPL
jgi:uncharacterized membrane protein YbhN (UPF0104 family)